MTNGLMTIRKTDEGVKTVFIDHEVLEFANLNKHTKERIQTKGKYVAKKKHSKKVLNAIAQRAMRDVAIGGAVALAGAVGLIHPAIWGTVSLFCLCDACVRLGMWFGKAEKK